MYKYIFILLDLCFHRNDKWLNIQKMILFGKKQYMPVFPFYIDNNGTIQELAF
ncbi:MAG: hypothetical protein RBR14_02085 [Candidatus Cloacimonas acidaminovorans]|nr:hypothetical protein [Candidatus Cloacimonas acidaminovorans]